MQKRALAIFFSHVSETISLHNYNIHCVSLYDITYYIYSALYTFSVMILFFFTAIIFISNEGSDILKHNSVYFLKIYKVLVGK